MIPCAREGFSSRRSEVRKLWAAFGSRRSLPDAIELPVDYNQALTVTQAIRRGRALESEGIAWLEELIRHDDYVGSAAIARALAVPVQIGENFNGPESMVEALGAAACDYVMPDAVRIGGVTGWIQAAGIAAGHRIDMSSHMQPEISAHLLAASVKRSYGSSRASRRGQKVDNLPSAEFGLFSARAVHSRFAA